MAYGRKDGFAYYVSIDAIVLSDRTAARCAMQALNFNGPMQFLAKRAVAKMRSLRRIKLWMLSS
jgi:hypothetical protein